MSLSNIIEVIGVIIPSVISSFAIWQNYKTIKNANRPYISVYLDYTTLPYKNKYLAIKNFGKTPAKILSLSFETHLDKGNDQFKLGFIIGGTICPGQKVETFLKHDFNGLINGTIKYQGMDNEKYVESFSVKTDMISKLVVNEQTITSDSDISTAIKTSAEGIINSLK
ncbi:MAG: hypothetical protein ABF483_00020 [Liquorilactobacillus nagelii]|nr:hypothetical protein [Liquorilactobacillus nagelii]KRL40499.1 hypothetical protein FD45_GL001917 [Liquorilactobacillus nagelii DSM 13675]MCC7616001.1 hypothetical protein [Liquorilactobacillus nagelii]MCP9314309.1 hypothetical protein [Liquorilactobacillus nagelii]QYH54432.1 hypothetical protein G6O73_06970 [Liquorilactobacillus nagelii DSM 13675]